jgi:Tol biopolymer transport system component
MIKLTQFYVIGLLCLWLAACSQISLPAAQPENKTNGIQLVKETRLVEEGWEIGPWSPDSSRLLVLKRDMRTEPGNVPIAVVNVEDGSRAEITHTGIGGCWSPDNAALVIESIDENQQPELWLYSLQNNQAIRLDGIAGRPLMWMADGRLVYEAEDGLWSVKLDLTDWNAARSTLTVSERTHLLSDARVDGRRWSLPSPRLESIMLSDGTNDQERKWWLVQLSGDWVRVDKSLHSIGTCCAWTQDGRRFAFFSSDPELGLYRMDADGKNLKRVLAAQDVGAGTFISMSFSPDGQTIAFEWSRDGEGFPFGNTQIYTVNVDGSGLQNLTPDSAPHHWLRWSPNGKYIAYEGEKGSAWVAQVTTNQ